MSSPDIPPHTIRRASLNVNHLNRVIRLKTITRENLRMRSRKDRLMVKQVERSRISSVARSSRKPVSKVLLMSARSELELSVSDRSTMSTLASCGGCPGETEGKIVLGFAHVDCAALQGVDEVRCARGRCVIGKSHKDLTLKSDSCARGYILQSTGVNSTASCTPKQSASWLKIQH